MGFNWFAGDGDHLSSKSVLKASLSNGSCFFSNLDGGSGKKSYTSLLDVWG